ncbi:MAG: diaminopimelate epimerase [Flavobacteriales bacterium]
MAIIPFSKWHGTGNDFILMDDRQSVMPVEAAPLARQLCHRHFGIGSDGLILLRETKEPGTDYHMEFLNPDGSKSFCGNGSRCAFAFRSVLVKDRSPARFTAIDGVHEARWVNDEVEITMRDVGAIEELGPAMDLVNTGSPHLVVWVEDPADLDIIPEAHAHRYSTRFAKEGVNVNFVRWQNGQVEMRTYERGVEAETLSCGTGVTAAALSAMARGKGRAACKVITPGGELHVNAERENGVFTKVLLRGPVLEVFRGTVEISL